MERISSKRLYNIQNDAVYFHTGRVKNGNQVLMGVLMPELVMVEFDGDGNYLGITTREIPKQFLSVINDIYRIEGYIQSALIENWQDEIGLMPGTISVKKFFLPDRWIGIQDLPDHFQEILDQPEVYDEEFRREIQDEMKQWLDSGNFVFWWGNDYYLNQEGEVESS